MPFEKGTSGNADAQFEPGQSGNPAGRKPGARNVSTVLKEMLAKIAPGEVIDSKFVKEFCKGKKRVTSADATAARIMFEALIKGEQWAMKELLDRTEGKAKQALELTGAEGAPLMQPVAEAILKVYGDGRGTIK